MNQFDIIPRNEFLKETLEPFNLYFKGDCLLHKGASFKLSRHHTTILLIGSWVVRHLFRKDLPSKIIKYIAHPKHQ